MLRNRRRIIAGAALAAVIGGANLAALAGTSFTYQGQLKNAGTPADGTFNMTFRLFDAPAGGGQPATAINIPNVDVAEGLFSVELDYGAAAFSGADRWLEIVVNGVPLSPRVEVTNAPYSTFSQNTRGLAVDASGDVGIGTTSPTANLQIGTGHNFGDVTTFGVAMRQGDTVGVSIRSNPAGFDPALQFCDAGFGCGYLGMNSTGSFYLTSEGPSRLGLGVVAPGFPLSFPNTLGDKISLWGSSGAHYGFGIQGSLLQIHSDVVGSAIAFGIGSSTAFTERMRITGGGNVGVGTTNPAKKLQIGDSNVPNSEGMIRLASRSGLGGAARDWDIGVPETDDDTNTGYSFVIDDIGFGSTPELMVHWGNGNVGIGTMSPAAKLDVVGTVRAQVVTITGGADVAEPFNVDNCGTERVQPGMVVSIDPTRIGEMRLSNRAYDRTVAGIISGAGGVRPGMLLSQDGTVADGEHPVAMTGRVWCWCDADANGAIAAGDLLTTAPTPGHGMRVTDHSLAPGATIGKAMSSLESGKGLVLVLVNLQ